MFVLVADEASVVVAALTAIERADLPEKLREVKAASQVVVKLLSRNRFHSEVGSIQQNVAKFYVKTIPEASEAVGGAPAICELEILGHDGPAEAHAGEARVPGEIRARRAARRYLMQRLPIYRFRSMQGVACSKGAHTGCASG
eukprot:3671454-Pleurochrysis_carterae.AAC.3